MSGITKNPELGQKIKHFADHTLNRMCKKYKDPTLQAGFEMFRNEMIFQLKYEKLYFSDVD